MNTHDETHAPVHINLKTFSIVVALVFQFSVLVWGAATMATAVSAVEIAVNRLADSQEKLNRELVELKIGQARIEGRIENLEEHNGTNQR